VFHAGILDNLSRKPLGSDCEAVKQIRQLLGMKYRPTRDVHALDPTVGRHRSRLVRLLLAQQAVLNYHSSKGKLKQISAQYFSRSICMSAQHSTAKLIVFFCLAI